MILTALRRVRKLTVLIFRNKAGLEGHLSRSNGKTNDLGAFSQGFNTSPFAAVAVDTVVTSQSADNALKGELFLYFDAPLPC